MSDIATHSSAEVWLSVAECAALLGASEWAIQKKAQRGKYLMRYVDGQRGGLGGKALRIALSSLPAHVQMSYWTSRPTPAHPSPAPIQAPDPAPSLAELPAWKLKEALRKNGIAQELHAVRADIPRGGLAATTLKYCIETGISPSAAYAYLRAYRQAPERAKISGLIPRAHKNRGRTLALTEDMKCLIVSHYCRETQPFMEHIYEELMDYCQSLAQPAPSRSTLRRFIATIPPAVLCLYREGPEAYQRQFGYFAQRDLNSLPIDAWWCIDHRQFDLLVYVDERRDRMVRPWLTAVMDLRSRFFVGWHIGLIPNSTTIGLALKSAIVMETDEERGVVRGFIPKMLYMDDGKDFRSAYLHGKTWRWQDVGKVTMNDEVRGVLDLLGIQPVHALPYHPQSKPIESNFRNIPFRFERYLPGWTGNSEQSRPEKLDGEIKRGDLLTIPELIERFPEFLRDHHNREHSSLRCTPAEVRAAAGVQVVEIDHKALWLLMMKSPKPCRVYTHGIRPLGEGLSFWNDALGLFVGQRIQVRYDPADVSIVYCFTPSGDFICGANNIPLSQIGETTEAEFKAAASRRKAAKKRVQAYREDYRLAGDITEAIRTVKRPPAEQEAEPLRAVANGEPMRLIGEMDHMAASMHISRPKPHPTFYDLSLSEKLDMAEALQTKGGTDES